jgi:hypothetical protein
MIYIWNIIVLITWNRPLIEKKCFILRKATSWVERYWRALCNSFNRRVWGFVLFTEHYNRSRGTRWRIWLRHCATSRKVAGSIGIFCWHNPSGRAMSVGSTQPLTGMSTRNISWEPRRPVPRVDLATLMCQLSWNPGASASRNFQGLCRDCLHLPSYNTTV